MTCSTRSVYCACACPTEAHSLAVPTNMRVEIQISFSNICARYAAGDDTTLHLRPNSWRRSAKACACTPVQAVKPSGFTSVIPSTGATPLAVTEKNNNACVISISSFSKSWLSKKLSKYPFCKNTKSPLRFSGQAWTMPSKASLRVAIKMGPVLVGSILSSRPNTTQSPASANKAPIRPLPIISAMVVVDAEALAAVEASLLLEAQPKTMFFLLSQEEDGVAVDLVIVCGTQATVALKI
mmetsp:Transcript_1105/g.1448  ORF Transcript_1105/g.1448 Transcript_1105/m.1448 type:complete len:239 (+) Transcript_1105:1678-2394(+)